MWPNNANADFHANEMWVDGKFYWTGISAKKSNKIPRYSHIQKQIKYFHNQNTGKLFYKWALIIPYSQKSIVGVLLLQNLLSIINPILSKVATLDLEDKMVVTMCIYVVGGWDKYLLIFAEMACKYIVFAKI